MIKIPVCLHYPMHTQISHTGLLSPKEGAPTMATVLISTVLEQAKTNNSHENSK